MRLGVLDIGSNTGHLLVVDAHAGAAPLPAYTHKASLRLAEHLDETGAVTAHGIDELVRFTADAGAVADDKGCGEMLAFATSAVREATNCDAVLDLVADRTGVRIEVMPGDVEARLTFLAVRRWFGWSAGRLAVFDIGGGSLEIAAGADESPDVAWSLPLGAARLAQEPDLGELRSKIRAQLAEDAGQLLRGGRPDRAVATSKTFRSLARICVAASLTQSDLRDWIPKLLDMSRDEIAELPGVSTDRAHQVVPGALVADGVMDIFDLDELQICPWALREGVILERLDQMPAHQL